MHKVVIKNLMVMAREVARRIRALAALVCDLVWFQAPMGQLITITCYSSSRRSSPFVWPLWELHAHHTSSYKQVNTPTQNFLKKWSKSHPLQL